MKALEGRRIDTIKVNSDFLSFETDQGPVNFTVEGDCCSNSYFHDLIGVEFLIGQTVEETSEIEMDPVESRPNTYDDVVVAYGFRIRTEKGCAVLSFRNNSNGYYGGSLESCDSVPADLPAITADWMAD